MLQKKQFSVEIAGKTLTIEVSALAEQANAAVIAKYGETVVLATAVMARKDSDIDYLPLKVDYEEKFYAAGKILGSRYVRREGRSSEEAILAGRLVDRTIRPLFNDHMRREIQVVVTVLQIDEQNDPEFVGCSASRPRSLSPTSRGTARSPACAWRRRRRQAVHDQSRQQRSLPNRTCRSSTRSSPVPRIAST